MNFVLGMGVSLGSEQGPRRLQDLDAARISLLQLPLLPQDPKALCKHLGLPQGR